MIVSTGLTVPVAVTARVIAPRPAGALTYCTGAVRCMLHHATPAATVSASKTTTTQRLRTSIRRQVDFTAVGGDKTCSKSSLVSTSSFRLHEDKHAAKRGRPR